MQKPAQNLKVPGAKEVSAFSGKGGIISYHFINLYEVVPTGDVSDFFRGFFSQEAFTSFRLYERIPFFSTKSTRAMLEQYRQENDHVARFLSETYQRHAESHVLEDDVFQAY